MDIQETGNKRQLISLTPLIDVVFILLIFFMLASSFSNWQFIELQVGDGESIEKDLDTQSLIAVGFNQQYTLNEKAMSLSDIEKTIKNTLFKQQNHPVLIQPEENLPLQELMVVLESLGKVAGPNLSLVKEGH